MYKEEYTRSFNSITSANNNTSENFSNKLLSSMRPLYQVLGLNVNTETLGSGNINITGILWRSGLFPTVHADTTSHLYYPSDNVKGNNAKIVKEFIDSLLVSKVFR